MSIRPASSGSTTDVPDPDTSAESDASTAQNTAGATVSTAALTADQAAQAQRIQDQTSSSLPLSSEQPAYSYDLSTMTPDKIDEVRKTDPALASTIERAQVAYADYLDPNNAVNGVAGKVVVTTSEGNGGKPVVVLVPPGFDPSQPAHVQTHFHGDSGTVTDEKGNGGVAGRAEALQGVGVQPSGDPPQDPPGVDRQRVFVLPECKNAVPCYGSASNSCDWSNVKNEAETTNTALTQAGVSNVATDGYIVSAHSGGGHGIMQAMKGDNANPGSFRCDHLELVDCIHYNPSDTGIETTIQDWAKKHPGEVKSVFAVHGTMGTPQDYDNIEDAFGSQTSFTMKLVNPNDKDVFLQDAKKLGRTNREYLPPPAQIPTDLATGGRDGKTGLPLKPGTPIPRWDAANPHSRARGQELGQNYW
jgi:hypothetical protein